MHVKIQRESCSFLLPTCISWMGCWELGKNGNEDRSQGGDEIQTETASDKQREYGIKNLGLVDIIERS